KAAAARAGCRARSGDPDLERPPHQPDLNAPPQPDLVQPLQVFQVQDPAAGAVPQLLDLRPLVGRRGRQDDPLPFPDEHARAVQQGLPGLLPGPLPTLLPTPIADPAVDAQEALRLLRGADGDPV